MNYATKHKAETLNRAIDSTSSTRAEIAGARIELARLIERSNLPGPDKLDALHPVRALPDPPAHQYRPELDDKLRGYIENCPRGVYGIYEARDIQVENLAQQLRLANILLGHATRADAAVTLFIEVFEITQSAWIKAQVLSACLSYVAFHSAVLSPDLLAQIQRLANGNPDLVEAATADTIRSFLNALRHDRNEDSFEDSLKQLRDGLKPRPDRAA
jgi:hypothetical protein